MNNKRLLQDLLETKVYGENQYIEKIKVGYKYITLYAYGEKFKIKNYKWLLKLLNDDNLTNGYDLYHILKVNK